LFFGSSGSITDAAVNGYERGFPEMSGSRLTTLFVL
jgi:hypothetical protein